MKRLITKYSWNQSQFIFTIFNQDLLQLLLRPVKCWFSRRWMRPRSSSADQETSWVSAEKEQLNFRQCGGSWCSWNIWGSRGLTIKSKNNPKQAGGYRLPRKKLKPQKLKLHFITMTGRMSPRRISHKRTATAFPFKLSHSPQKENLTEHWIYFWFFSWWKKLKQKK